MRSQKDKILNYLKTHNNITPLQALLELGIYRLSARILDLRKEGKIIKTDLIKKGQKRYASYSLIKVRR